MIFKILKVLSALPLVASLAFSQHLGTNPAIPPNLQVTTFATGLSFPYGLYQLPDGSLLASTSTGGLYGTGVEIVRYTGTNGVANAPTTVFSGGLSGPATALTGVGNIVAVATGTHTGSQIIILQAGPGGALTQIGAMTFTYPPSGWWHDSHSMAMRAVAGQPNAYELVFNIGSEFNNTPTLNTVSVAGIANATLNGSSIYSLPFTVNGSTVNAGAPRQLATGLRNAFGDA